MDETELRELPELPELRELVPSAAYIFGLPTFPSAAGVKINTPIDTATTQINGVSEEIMRTTRPPPRCACTRLEPTAETPRPTAQLSVHAQHERDTSLFSYYLLEAEAHGLTSPARGT